MNPIKVLLVEDDVAFAERLCRYLESSKEFTVSRVTYGMFAELEAERQLPDLIVLDWRLQNDLTLGDLQAGDGEQVARYFRIHCPHLRHIPILLLSGLCDVREAEARTLNDEGDGIFWLSKDDVEHRRIGRIANIFLRWRVSPVVECTQ